MGLSIAGGLSLIFGSLYGVLMILGQIRAFEIYLIIYRVMKFESDLGG